MLGETPDTPPHAGGVERRVLALLQVIVVSGFPTQLAVTAALVVTLGLTPFTGDGLSLEFVAIVSFLDTALVSLLIWAFLRASGESSHQVFLGKRPVLGEAWRGLVLVPPVLITLTLIVAGIRFVAPSLHTVPENPLAAFMRDPFDAAIFLVVVILAGGVREELQRGFILHRWGQHLGGAWLGNLLFGLLFGALHLDQGADISIAVGLLGMGWGAIYILRGSVVMSMVNHAGFNAAMVAQQVLARSLGVTP